MSENVLVIDDDAGVRTTLEQFLTRYGYGVSLTENGEQGLAQLNSADIDLVLLDLNLPGMDGLEIARTVRRTSDVPIIMLTGRADEIDRVIGLEVGADDYVAKPFSSRELVARIRAVLKRSQPVPQEEESGPVRCDRFGPWTVDHDRRVLIHEDGREERLTFGEYDLLHVFLEHPNRLLSRDQLLELSRNRELEPFDRSVDIQVSRLRRKIEPNPREPIFVLTVRGAGYRFSPKAEG